MRKSEEMFTKLQRTCIFHIKSNITYYVLILCGFLCGGVIAAACIFGISELSQREISVYLADFFLSIGKNGTESFEVFKIAVLANLSFFIAVLFFAMMVIGLPFLVIISVGIGFSFSFTIFFVFKVYAIKGMLLFLGGIFLHQLIIFPCYALALMISMKFSVSFLKGKNDIKAALWGYLLKMLVLFGISVLAALLQAYIEPLFLELMSPLFING